jgi:hypothetical protein
MIARMRALLLIGLVGAAACSHGDTGLAITLSAPDVPPGADRIEVVMASPDVVTVEGQPPGAVRYYRQKSSAGVLDKLTALDGYSLRIEGRPGKGDEKFIPLVIAYAGDAPVAVGAVPAPDGKPLALVVPDSSRIEATVAMVPLQAVDLPLEIAIGQLAEMRCGANSGAWRSGIVWHPPGDDQLRLLFPDPDSASQLDASSRPLDLDCDDYRADGGDCDDLRPRLNPGATEACDGVDVNCDGPAFAFVQCNPPEIECGAGSTDGIALCRDTATGTPGLCMGSPACRCRSTSGTNLCSKCTLAFKGSSTSASPCSPGLAKVQLEGCLSTAPCLVQVVHYLDDTEWDIEIAPNQQAEFKSSSTSYGELWLRVKSRRETVSAAPGASIGAVHLVVVNSLSSFRPIGFDLQLKDTVDDCSSVAAQLPETYQMSCSFP